MSTHRSIGSRTLGETIEELAAHDREPGPPQPGLLLVYCDRVATAVATPPERGAIRIGRDELARLGLRDERLSREHAMVQLARGQLLCEDRHSRNGTFVDGVALEPGAPARAIQRTLRCGRSVWVRVEDLRPFERGAVSERDGLVFGPTLEHVLRAIESLASRAPTLFLRGESGAGKEIAARAFHRASPGSAGPFVAVNCATVPAALAERLFFGARRGAYSGAHEDTVGYFQAADGGTLFLDELAELDASTQAKLLRAIETREITPLGHTRARSVDLRIVCATLAPLERAVSEGRFRADLFHRLATPSVLVPPLRDRPEEIAMLARRALDQHGAAPALDAELVEQCLLRHWHGNVRELLHTLAEAAHRWTLAPHRPLRLPAPPALEDRALEAPTIPAPPAVATRVRRPAIELDAARAAVAACGGNISAAARSLGLHRTQLRRILASETAS